MTGVVLSSALRYPAVGMWNWLRVSSHLVRGRRYLWQYYTDVTWRTCEDCLRWHGRIAGSPAAFPKQGDSCKRELLRFPVWELGAYREKARAMQERARRELERRRLFQEALRLLPEDPQGAVALFDRAGAVDVYIPELERLSEEYRELLSREPGLRQELRELFLRRFSGKFQTPRYERLPELMRTERERWGAGRIKELFS